MDLINDMQTFLADPDIKALVAEIQNGLPLVDRPYAVIGERLGIPEAEIMNRIRKLMELGVIKRLGIVVRHHELGFRSNAMIVWDVPDDLIREVGRCFAAFPFVTLCYQRPRRLPDWPYNLFTMIHGKDREQVLLCMDELATACGLADIPHRALFSTRRFKQRGARYTASQRNPDASGQRVLAGDKR